MGIDVSAAKIVTFNPNHEQRVITDSEREPPREKFNQLKVVSVFARRTIRRDNHDGNPLIYALKGKKGYTMPYRSFLEIYDRARLILPKALEGMQFDMILPLPSSSKVASIFAKRISRWCDNQAILACLDKATFGEILAKAPSPVEIEKRFQRDYKKQLHELQSKDPNHVFEMKQVKLSLRSYFTPVVANQHAPKIKGLRVLLVDDILGSGTSIMQAAEAIKPSEPQSVIGLTLMGKLA
jgi:hypothetical protein